MNILDENMDPKKIVKGWPKMIFWGLWHVIFFELGYIDIF